MIEVKGKYGIVKIFNDAVEETAMSQIIQLINHPISEGSQIRIMSDVHAGAGCVIGYTAEMTGKVCPNLIGVDISCAVQGWNLGKVDIDFAELDEVIRNYVPCGHNVHEKVVFSFDKQFEKNVKEICKRMEQDINRVKCSIGSLGGGNHYHEIGEGEDGNRWLFIHSGSRNFGLKIATYHQRKANALHHNRKDGLSYIEGEDAKEYYRDMKVAQKYSNYNRLTMGKIILDKMNLSYSDTICSVHNYIDFEDKIVRKGAISSHKGEMVVIPFNMRDGSIIGVGKGNADWNNSAPHGAGRVMSRRKAKENISLNDFKDTMNEAGVWTSCVSKATLDEAPDAYKKADHIIKYLEPTVEIKHRLRPVYNFKSS